jgi:hypothetical protein
MSSSKHREVGSLTSGTDEISIEAGIEMDFLPLLVKETVGTVSDLVLSETNSGFRVSALILTVNVSPEKTWVKSFCGVNYSNKTLVLDLG